MFGGCWVCCVVGVCWCRFIVCVFVMMLVLVIVLVVCDGVNCCIVMVVM